MIATWERKILVKRGLRTDGTETCLFCLQKVRCGASVDVWQRGLAGREANRVYTDALSLQQQNAGRDRQRLLVPVSDIRKE